jgi:hypothetical protein
MHDYYNSQMLGEFKPGDDLTTIIKTPTLKLAGAALAGAVATWFLLRLRRRR